MPIKNLMTRATFEITNVETRESDDGKECGISGYAATFEKLSVPLWGFKEKIRAGAFSESLKKDNVRALWNHNPDHVLGSTKGGTLRLSEDKKGLRFDLDLPDTQAGRDALVSIKRGDVEGMSFGFFTRKQEWDETDPKNVVRTLIDVDLREVSPTVFPAYPSTSVSARSISDDYEEYTEVQRALLLSSSDVETNQNELDILKRRVDLQDVES